MTRPRVMPRHSSEGGSLRGNRPSTATPAAAQRAEARAHGTALIDSWTVLYLLLWLALTVASALASRSVVDWLVSTSRCIGGTA